MIINYVSSKLVIARVFEDFNVDYTDWVGRSHEWIGAALSNVGHGLMLVDEFKEVEVENYKAKLPCFVEGLNYIEYEGQRLPPIKSADFVNATKKAETVFDFNYYRIQNGYVYTSFETGTVVVYYRTYATEYDKLTNNYYPMVPDNEKVLEYLVFEVLRHMLMRGYKHHTLNLNYVEGKINGVSGLKHKARNGMKRLSRDERELISVAMKSLLVNPTGWKNHQFNASRNGGAI